MEYKKKFLATQSYHNVFYPPEVVMNVISKAVYVLLSSLNLDYSLEGWSQN